MASRDRSRRAQLQALLEDLGTVQPYVARANGVRPTAGWYVLLGPIPPGPADGFWFARDGALFIGPDTTHAAATIERLRAGIAG